MTRARPALLLLAATALFSLWAPAARGDEPVAHGSVILLVVDRVSFEEAMAVPEFESLARGGGWALMTTRVGGGDRTVSSYSTMASGAVVSPTTGEPLLLPAVLEAHGIDVCLFPTLPQPLVEPGPALVFAGANPHTCAGNFTVNEEGIQPRVSARGPGIPDRTVVVYAEPSLLRLDTGVTQVEVGGQAAARRDALVEEGRALAALLTYAEGRTIALVVTPAPSSDMQRAGDEVTPLVMAVGQSRRLLSDAGRVHSLRSKTTRQSGLVANVDVAPTILDFFGIPIPEEMTGSPIRIDDTADVGHLHRLHLDQRHVRLPLQLGEVAYVGGLGIVAIAMLIWIHLGRRLPGSVANLMAFLALCGAALPIPLMAGGLLPRLTYPVVVPFVVLSVLGLAAVALAARWPGWLGPFVFIGAAGLAFIVIEALFGWRGMRIPLLGGTMFDGVRFYGLPNVFIATLLAGALFLATRLDPWAGTVVLFGAGLFAGFPALGANVGAAITLFLAAGLWWVLRTRLRYTFQDLLVVAGVVAVGLGLVLLANRYLPGGPTHITGFVERNGNGVAGVWNAFRDRLDVGFGQIRHVLAAWVPLLGLPIILVTAIVRPEPIRRGLAAAGEVWRDALIVLTVAGMAAFFANDTGVAAAAPVFMYAATAMAYPAFLAERR